MGRGGGGVDDRAYLPAAMMSRESSCKAWTPGGAERSFSYFALNNHAMISPGSVSLFRV